MKQKNEITFALSAKWDAYPDRFNWIIDNRFSLEYSPGPDNLELIPLHVGRFITEGIPLRYHGLLPGYEIGHADIALADVAMRKYMAVLEAIHGLDESVITFHIGFNPNDPIDFSRATANLRHLVEYARSLGITVCLENLRRGLTSNPKNLVALAHDSGAMITLDTGHALSCDIVKSGKLTALDFLEVVADRLFEVHIYEEEAHRHLPPKDMTILGPVVDHLLETKCKWWTIELDDYDEALTTRNLLLDYLQSKSLLNG